MTRASRALLALPILCGALAACGESTDEVPAVESRFERLEARAFEIGTEIEQQGFTDPSTLPTTGGATYEGIMRLDVADIPNAGLEDFDLAGDVTLEVNFAGTGSVTGTAENFVSAEDEAFSGRLSLDGGFIDRAADPSKQPTFTADLSGGLVDEDGTAWAVDEGTLLGDFAGEDHEYAVGDLSGVLCGGAVGCSDLTGEIVAER